MNEKVACFDFFMNQQRMAFPLLTEYVKVFLMSTSGSSSTWLDCVIIPIPCYKNDAVAAEVNKQQRKLQK